MVSWPVSGGVSQQGEAQITTSYPNAGQWIIGLINTDALNTVYAVAVCAPAEGQG